jgi:hypothetical protein
MISEPAGLPEFGEAAGQPLTPFTFPTTRLNLVGQLYKSSHWTGYLMRMDDCG